MRHYTLFDRAFMHSLTFVGDLFKKERSMIFLQSLGILLCLVLAVEYYFQVSK